MVTPQSSLHRAELATSTSHSIHSADNPKTNGDPNGMLLDNAMDLVAKNIPKPTKLRPSRRYSRASIARSSSAGVKSKTPAVSCRIRNHPTRLRRPKSAIAHDQRRYGPVKRQRIVEKWRDLNAFDHRFTQRTIKVILTVRSVRAAGLIAPYSDKPTLPVSLRRNRKS